MTPRLSSAEYAERRGERNRRAMKTLVDRGAAPGLIAYRGKQPVGWCALAPRDEYVRYARSRVAKSIDGRSAWAIACLYVADGHRGSGVGGALIRAAVEHARRNGAELVEAWPVDPKGKRLVDVFAWNGIASSFIAAGFREVARRTPTRPYVRRELGGERSTAR